jgi:hypothetical protein
VSWRARALSWRARALSWRAHALSWRIRAGVNTALTAFSPTVALPGREHQPMRLALVLCSALVAVVPAQAETHIFVVAANADGYGIDRCLAAGEACGTAVATAYCRARDFEHAVSFRKVARDELTGTVTAATCAGSCDDYVAIECER